MFVIICKNCGKEYEIKTEEDISKSPVYSSGYDGQIGLSCKNCDNNIAEGD